MCIDRLDHLRAEARYARQRYQRYKAKAYGQRPTSGARLRELPRIYEGAEARLRFAEAEERLLPVRTPAPRVGADVQQAEIQAAEDRS